MSMIRFILSHSFFCSNVFPSLVDVLTKPVVYIFILLPLRFVLFTPIPLSYLYTLLFFLPYLFPSLPPIVPIIFLHSLTTPSTLLDTNTAATDDRAANEK